MCVGERTYGGTVCHCESICGVNLCVDEWTYVDTVSR